MTSPPTRSDPAAAILPGSAQHGLEVGAALLEARGLVVEFGARRSLGRARSRLVRAVSDVSLQLSAGETLGVAGESGSGKSTLLRALVGLVPIADGEIMFCGRVVTWSRSASSRAIHRQIQMVFQDPYGSLNPRARIDQMLIRVLRTTGITKGEALEEAQHLLVRVGLDPAHLTSYPHELSGGQRQRVGIARALALQPRVVLLDEPVSSLDVSIQAQIVNLLRDLQAEGRISYIFVAHDLAVMRHLADRIAVMYLGRIVEIASAHDLYARPLHPYTATLLAAVPVPDPRLSRNRRRAEVAAGEPPDALTPPQGCPFSPRCASATDLCRTVEPRLDELKMGHAVACHHPLGTSLDDAVQIRSARPSAAQPS